MKILLIGGTGTLSTDICKYCLEKEYDVTIINRGNNNKDVDKKVKILTCDVRDVKKAREILGDNKYDVIIDFISFNKEQLKTTLEIFNNRCCQFIFISSATVYEKTSKRITEKTKLENKEWDYAQYKIDCEKYLEENYKKTKQKYTIVRPYVTYGNKRIPFAIIPRHHWTLINRILIGKPILLWDGGKAKCTLTNTKDFSKGIVGLFMNEKAYNNDFHITSDEYLTWKEALNDIGAALNKKPISADIPSDYIVQKMPELKGMLYGDKGLDRIFNNSKIKSVVDGYDAKIKFSDGIKDTIKNYKKTSELQVIDYGWDAEIDYLIEQYYKEYGYPKNFDKKILTSSVYKNIKIKEKIRYFIYRHNKIKNLYKLIRGYND